MPVLYSLYCLWRFDHLSFGSKKRWRKNLSRLQSEWTIFHGHFKDVFNTKVYPAFLEHRSSNSSSPVSSTRRTCMCFKAASRELSAIVYQSDAEVLHSGYQPRTTLYQFTFIPPDSSVVGFLQKDLRTKSPQIFSHLELLCQTPRILWRCYENRPESVDLHSQVFPLTFIHMCRQ